MEWINSVIQAIITMGAIAGAFMAMAKFEDFKYNPLTWVKKKFSEVMDIIAIQSDKIISIEEKIDGVILEQHNQKMEILGMKVYLKDLPDVERYKAAQEYLANNGNHGRDIYCKILLKEYGEKLEQTESIL